MYHISKELFENAVQSRQIVTSEIDYGIVDGKRCDSFLLPIGINILLDNFIIVYEIETALQ